MAVPVAAAVILALPFAPAPIQLIALATAALIGLSPGRPVAGR